MATNHRTDERFWPFLGYTFRYCEGPTCHGSLWMPPPGHAHGPGCQLPPEPPDAPYQVLARHLFPVHVAFLFAYDDTTLPVAVIFPTQTLYRGRKFS